MEVIAVESSAFQEMKNMFSKVCKMHIAALDEIERLKDPKWLTAEQASQRVKGAYAAATILAKKHEIGFDPHQKIILFKTVDFDAWVDRDYQPPTPLKVVQRHYK